MDTEQFTPKSDHQFNDSKTIALISYLTVIGWVIAFVMHGNNKTSLGIFHLRQSAFLMLCAIALYAVQFFLLFIPYIGWMLSILIGTIGLGLFILWIFGLITAINGEEKPLPLLGTRIQHVLRGIS
ncbi:hypothetical protein DU508_00145 [Pedobacter chinensis]|uniref:DUF4870 domain-containing protein n=1 Tax=Pedobacter chinensis TaxID=2282421 RepID=A0A369Q0N9_9SPHI|nr:hypothetical protein [Pedobacter chinensis]RDC58453.1 hypothetical protein DU508_00145 [Pedobacter chinensis]